MGLAHRLPISAEESLEFDLESYPRAIDGPLVIEALEAGRLLSGLMTSLLMPSPPVPAAPLPYLLAMYLADIVMVKQPRRLAEVAFVCCP